MSNPIVSVVVVNYNGGQHLLECLSALYLNSDLASEIILVDNASTDGSVIDALDRYPEVRVLANSTNQGYARGINAGVRSARGAFVAILNMDVVVEKNWLSPLIEFLRDEPNVGAVTPRIMLYEQPQRINAIGQNIHVTGLGFNRKLGCPSDKADLEPVRVSGLQGGAFALRTETFRLLGGMNEIFFLYHEDVELSLRLTLAGLSIYAIPESVVRHKYSLRMTPEKLNWLERHRWLSILATYRLSTFLGLSPLLLLTETLMAGYCLLRGPSFVNAKARSVHWVLSHRAELKASRQRAQSVRRVSDWSLLRDLRWSYDWDQFLTLARQPGGWIREALPRLLARRAHDRVA